MLSQFYHIYSVYMYVVFLFVYLVLLSPFQSLSLFRCQVKLSSMMCETNQSICVKILFHDPS